MQKPDRKTKELLIHYAELYETTDFLCGDPSWFMHQVEGPDNQEAMAFIASCLSYGSRRQFMQKIRLVLDWAHGDVDGWVRNGLFGEQLRAGDTNCFYRLYNCDAMHRFLSAYRQLLLCHGSLGTYVRGRACDGIGAVTAICKYFSETDSGGIIPKDTSSACKRVCMFLRWMVRNSSPVDLGLWADFIDRRSLIVPLDTHVLQQSYALGLLSCKTTTMKTAQRLTAALAEIFPDDPLKGDFALFGHGVNSSH